MPALPPPPPGIDLSDDRSPELYVGSIVSWALAVLVVLLRVWNRRLRKVRLWIDDYLCFLGLVSTTALTVLAVYTASRGQGKHVWAGPPDALYVWALTLFGAEITYTFTLAFVKWSILTFYWKTFNVVTSMRISIIAVGVAVGLWFLAVNIVAFLQCQPTSAFWTRFDPVSPRVDNFTCDVDQKKYFLANALVTIITDLAILALPIPHILSIRMRLIHKVGITFMFLLGIFVTIISIIRITFVMKVNLVDPDLTWNFLDTGKWSIVEGNMAVVSCCLPFLKPTLEALYDWPRSHISSLSTELHKMPRTNESEHNLCANENEIGLQPENVQPRS